MKESPLQKITDKMFLRINESSVKTKKLAQIIQMAFEMREGLLEGRVEERNPDNDWWAEKGIKDFTEIIVRANHKAQQIINPSIVMNDLEEQINQALDEVVQN